MPATRPEEICRLFQRYMADGDLESLLGIYDPETVILTQSGEVKRGQGLREQLAGSATAKTQFVPLLYRGQSCHFLRYIQRGQLGGMGVGCGNSN
jgi:hypothetical protein